MMTEKKKIITSAMLSMICVVMLLSSAIPYRSAALTNSSIKLICAQDDVKVSDMNWKIYKVGERKDNSFALTGEYSKYPVDLSDLDTETARGAAQALESFIIGDKLNAEAEGVTDSSGTVIFNGLEKGLYLAVAKRVRLEPSVYMATPLLFEIKEDGSAEEAFPKIYSVITLDGEVGSYTVKKVWVDNDDSYMARPVNVTVDLFKDGELYDTVVLDESTNWEHRWNTLDLDSEWRVVERNIPVKYAVYVDYNSKQFLIKNSYAPDLIIDGGSYSKATTTTSSVTTTTTTTAMGSSTTSSASTTKKAVTTTASSSGLPQTGQLWWPIIPLALGGMALICIGLLPKQKNKDDEG